MIKNVMIISLTIVVLTNDTNVTNNNESINTLESIRYHIVEDMNSHRVDTLVAVTYIDNIDKVVTSLRQ